MLYDNALLCISYLEAAQLTKNKMFFSVARETIGYLLREMQDVDGGFYSAQDAGDVGREGEFYVWSENDLLSLLSEDEFEVVKEAFGISGHGNFEDNFNVLNFESDIDWEKKESPILKAALEKMFNARSQRRAPHTDDKILTSWNALTISALVKGYQTLGDDNYLEQATKCAEFLNQTLWKDGMLFRRYRDGETRFLAYLDDYSYLIQALLDIHETNGDSRWLNWAQELQSVLDKKFWDSDNAGYFFTLEESAERIIRKKEFTDSSTPSGNAISALNLYRLYHLTYNQDYIDRAQDLCEAFSSLVNQFPSALCSSLLAIDFKINNPWELVIAGDTNSKETSKLKDFLFHEFSPYRVISWSNKISSDRLQLSPDIQKSFEESAEQTFYLCRNQTCDVPKNDAASVIEKLKSTEPLNLSIAG
jgi:uncharacterized protein YyaL (SSP411 family)